MVAVLHIFSAFAAVIFATLPVPASPKPSPAPISIDSVLHGLLKRQTSATYPHVEMDGVPQQCKSSCQDTNDKVSSCSSDQCFCKDSIMESLGGCLSCVVANNPNAVLDEKTAQNSMDLLTGVCNKEGFKVKSVKIGSGSQNSATRSEFLSSGVIAVVALGVVLGQP